MCAGPESLSAIRSRIGVDCLTAESCRLIYETCCSHENISPTFDRLMLVKLQHQPVKGRRNVLIGQATTRFINQPAGLGSQAIHADPAAYCREALRALPAPAPRLPVAMD